jgi:hypothetical protein
MVLDNEHNIIALPLLRQIQASTFISFTKVGHFIFVANP